VRVGLEFDISQYSKLLISRDELLMALAPRMLGLRESGCKAADLRKGAPVEKSRASIKEREKTLHLVLDASEDEKV
jgi:hypothetical protein